MRVLHLWGLDSQGFAFMGFAFVGLHTSWGFTRRVLCLRRLRLKGFASAGLCASWGFVGDV